MPGNHVTCKRCTMQMVPVQKTSMLSIGGIFSALLFLIGIVVLFANAVIGLITIIVAIVISYSGGKKTVMICPQCGTRGRTL